jgi:hypothetical protein
MHPDDLPAPDFSPISAQRLPTIIQAVQRLQADIENGDGPHVARDAVVRRMARLEGGETLGGSDAVSRELPQATRLAIQLLFERVKHGNQAEWLDACKEFFVAVSDTKSDTQKKSASKGPRNLQEFQSFIKKFKQKRKQSTSNEQAALEIAAESISDPDEALRESRRLLRTFYRHKNRR